MCTASPNRRFRGPRIEAVKYTKEHLYSGEVLFHVESQVFEKAKSLKSSEDKLRGIAAIRFSGYFKQFLEVYGKYIRCFMQIYFVVFIEMMQCCSY